MSGGQTQGQEGWKREREIKITTKNKKAKAGKRHSIQPKQQHQSFLNGTPDYNFLRLRKYRL